MGQVTRPAKGKACEDIPPEGGKPCEDLSSGGGEGSDHRHTINKELSFARAVFYDWIAACEDREVPAKPNPVRQRRRGHSDGKLFLPEPAARTRYLTECEEERLHEAIGEQHWPKVLVALHTGLDRGAEFGLRWSDVDFRTRTIHAERRKGRRSGPVPVTIPINDDTRPERVAVPERSER